MALFLRRKCEIIAESADGKKAVCIDVENKNKLLAYLNKSPRHLKKFRYIIELLLNGHRNSDLYDKEDIRENATQVYAMKFFKGQENDRIYCVQQSSRKFLIIMAELLIGKKRKKLTKVEIGLINKISNYDYEIE